jgi:hypothetical protein
MEEPQRSGRVLKSGRLVLAGLLLLSLRPLAAEDRPEYALDLAVASNEVDLGDQMKFTVALEKRKGKPVQVHALRLARNSGSLRVEFDGSEQTVTRIHAELVRAEGGRIALKDEAAPQR